MDSDIASELTLARHLAERGALVSRDWYYSTEVRLLGTQIVYTPLMALFPHNWRLVRTLGDILLAALLGAASALCARALGAPRRFAALSAALAVGVNSPAYAEYMLVGGYYVPHAVLTLAAVGLFAHFVSRGRPRDALLAAAVCFAACASSVRYLLLAVAPISAAALWRYALPKRGQELPRSPRQRAEVLAALLAAAAGLAGRALAQRLIEPSLHGAFDYYGAAGYADWATADLFAKAQEALGGLLAVLGFQGGVPLFGAQGILNALVLLTLPAGALLLARGLRRSEGAARLGQLTLVFSFFLTLAAFVLLGSLYFERYWLGVTALGAPVIAACLGAEDNAALRRLAALLFAGTALLTGASCVHYAMKNPEADRDMRMAAVDALRERGLDKGYATFWNANVVTELSNGEIDVVCLERVEAEGGASMRPYRWLEAEQDFALDRPDSPVFLLLGEWEKEGMEPFLAKIDAEQIPIAGYIELYVIPEQRRLFEAMGEAP